MSSVIPDRIGVVIGWRGYQLRKGHLLSVNGTEWEPGQELVAACTRSKKHEAPAKDCTCGIYVARSLDHLREVRYNDLGLIAEVAIWGHIIEATLGFRAQFAYPKRLFLPWLRWREADTLDAYKVPVKLLNPHRGDA